MKAVALKAYPRAAARRSGVKKLRAAGRVPAVIYGRAAAAARNLEVDLKELENLLHHAVSETMLVDLAVAQDAQAKRLALVQEVQHHPLNGRVLHVDFHEVSAEEKVLITVPVESVGEATGVKNGGGVLEHVLFKLKVRALPKDLPEVIEVDVAHLEIGQSIHLGEIKMPAGVELLGDKNAPVLTVAAPITEAEEAAAAEAATTAPGEVEMIKEKKEEGEAAPGDKGKAAPVAGKAADKGAAPAADKGAEKKPAAAEKKK